MKPKLHKLIKLDLRKTYGILMTRGRLNRQTTIRYLSPEVRQDVIVVTVEDELNDLVRVYQGNDWKVAGFLTFPSSMRLLRKRFCIVHWLESVGISGFIFLEDDLKLSVLNDDLKYRTTRNPEFFDTFTNAWSSLCKRVLISSSVGASTPGRNYRNALLPQYDFNGYYFKPARMNCGIFGYSTEGFLRNFSFLEKHHLLDDATYLDDISSTILLSISSPVDRFYNIGWSTSNGVVTDTGGMNTYRNDRTEFLALVIQQILIPGMIEILPAERVKASGGYYYGACKSTLKVASLPVLDWPLSSMDFHHFHRISKAALGKSLRHLKNPKAKAYLTSLLEKMRQMTLSPESAERSLTISSKGVHFSSPSGCFRGRKGLKLFQRDVEDGQAVPVCVEGTLSSDPVVLEFKRIASACVLLHWREPVIAGSKSLTSSIETLCSRVLHDNR